MLFRRLIQDPTFRDYFTDLVLGLLHHSIDAEFLQGLLERYAYTGVPSGNFNNIDLVEFMRRRPAWVVRDLESVVGAGPIYEVAVESAEHVAIEGRQLILPITAPTTIIPVYN